MTQKINWKNQFVEFTRKPVILNTDFLNDNFFRNKVYSAYYFLNKKFGSYSVAIEKAEALINKLTKVVES